MSVKPSCSKDGEQLVHVRAIVGLSKFSLRNVNLVGIVHPAIPKRQSLRSRKSIHWSRETRLRTAGNPNRSYRISMPMSHGSIRPIASSATAIQSGGRLPLPVPFTIAMISATNAHAKLIWGITKLSSFCEWYHALESPEDESERISIMARGRGLHLRPNALPQANCHCSFIGN